jgi:hypothetical protein
MTGYEALLSREPSALENDLLYMDPPDVARELFSPAPQRSDACIHSGLVMAGR